MCGGDLQVEEGMTVCECEYCSTKQTVPTIDNEKKIKLFERANRLRMDCQFDKAATVYESIIEEFDSEAEGYWGNLLCKYGIEYVDDPATGNKVPTCHRSSFDSVMDDKDFEMVMENCDAISRNVYREQAKQIEEIRKGIIEVSGKEEPYDIFICYKETAEDGQRTIDSVIAQDVYDVLTDKGYRVFFSRITLEDKIGTEYEPYIFAALNSAKVMLAFGTTYDYYNAVWVKNEWSRYLKLMAKDKTKYLIPCYKDIDAYDIPKEFAKLQAQDMGKVGATQDLIRGIEKILGTKKQEVVKETVVVQGGNNTNVTAMIKRGNLALEDKDWDKADKFFEEALNQDPECAEAYLGELLAANKVGSIDSYLSNLESRYSSETSERFYACEEEAEHINLVAKENAVEGYLEADDIKKLYAFDRTYRSSLSNIEEEKNGLQSRIDSDKLLSRVRQYATGTLKEQVESGLANLVAVFDARIAEVQQADDAQIAEITAKYRAHIEEADRKVQEMHIAATRKAQAKRIMEEQEKHRYYESIVVDMNNATTVSAYEGARDKFKALGDYEDSLELANKCQSEINRINEEERQEKARLARKAMKVAIISVSAIVVLIAIIMVIVKVIIPTNKYNKAIELMNNGQYSEAITVFENLNGYKDSNEQITSCQTAIKDIDYDAACKLMNNAQYDEAITAFKKLNGYKDSETQALECKYELAVSYKNQEQYDEAITAFKNLNGYKDSDEQINNCQIAINDIDYNQAVELMNNGQLTEAIAALRKLNGYKDSNELIVKYAVGHISTLSIGDTFYYGTYNGEPLEWTILDIKDNQVFAITTNAIDKRPYNDTHRAVTWASCSLRTWLNGEFFNEAFSPEEQSRIMTTTVTPGYNPEYSTNAGNSTEDKVFLLSIDEANQYFISYVSRMCNYYRDACWWWLRSPGIDQGGAASVRISGSVSYKGLDVVTADAAVRPALWINLES